MTQSHTHLGTLFSTLDLITQSRYSIPKLQQESRSPEEDEVEVTYSGLIFSVSMVLIVPLTSHSTRTLLTE